jgi:filamentous hemagglutinin
VSSWWANRSIARAQLKSPQSLPAGGAGNTGRSRQVLGEIREQKVADITGGAVSREPIKSIAGGTDIDVIAANGDLVMVGGPAKASNLGKLGTTIKIYQDEAAVRGVKAIAYFSSDTPQSVIDFTAKRLGVDNVFIFD